jgi:hypothetical protein
MRLEGDRGGAVVSTSASFIAQQPRKLGGPAHMGRGGTIGSRDSILLSGGSKKSQSEEQNAINQQTMHKLVTKTNIVLALSTVATLVVSGLWIWLMASPGKRAHSSAT